MFQVQGRQLVVTGRIFSVQSFKSKIMGKGNVLKLCVNFQPEVIALSKEASILYYNVLQVKNRGTAITSIENLWVYIDVNTFFHFFFFSCVGKKSPMAGISSSSGYCKQSPPGQPAVSICHLSNRKCENLPENLRKGEKELIEQNFINLQ